MFFAGTNTIRPIVPFRQWRLLKEGNMNDSVVGFLVAAEMSALFWLACFWSQRLFPETNIIVLKRCYHWKNGSGGGIEPPTSGL